MVTSVWEQRFLIDYFRCESFQGPLVSANNFSIAFPALAYKHDFSACKREAQAETTFSNSNLHLRPSSTATVLSYMSATDFQPPTAKRRLLRETNADAQDKEMLEKCKALKSEIDELLSHESLKAVPESDDEEEEGQGDEPINYSLLESHRNLRTRHHYLTVYRECLKGIIFRHPFRKLLESGVEMIDAMISNQRFPPEVIAESPSFLVYMAFLKDLLVSEEKRVRNESDTGSGRAVSTEDEGTQEENDATPSVASIPAGTSAHNNAVAREVMFMNLDELIRDYDRDLEVNKEGVKTYQHVSWSDVAARMTSGIFRESSSINSHEHLSRSAEWIIATLEETAHAAFSSLHPSTVQEFLPHFGTQSCETVNHTDDCRTSLFVPSPNSGTTELLDELHKLRADKRKRKRSMELEVHGEEDELSLTLDSTYHGDP